MQVELLFKAHEYIMNKLSLMNAALIKHDIFTLCTRHHVQSECVRQLRAVFNTELREIQMIFSYKTLI